MMLDKKIVCFQVLLRTFFIKKVQARLMRSSRKSFFIILGLCNKQERRPRRLVSEFNEGNGTHSRMKTVDEDSNFQPPVEIQEDVVDV